MKLKPNNIWVDKGSEFYNRSMKSCLEEYDIEMHSTHNEGKSAVVKRLIRTLKSKIYKYMTWVSKNVYIDKLDDIVDEYNNKYHRTIKMKPVDVISGNYNEYNVNSNDKNPKIQVGDNIRISKDKNISSWPRRFEDIAPLKVVMSKTYRGLSGDPHGTTTKTDDLMKKLFFRSNSPCITYVSLFQKF